MADRKMNTLQQKLDTLKEIISKVEDILIKNPDSMSKEEYQEILLCGMWQSHIEDEFEKLNKKISALTFKCMINAVSEKG